MLGRLNRPAGAGDVPRTSQRRIVLVFDSVTRIMKRWVTLIGLVVIGCCSLEDLPEEEDPGSLFAAVSAGGQHTCAITDEGSVVCWGDNSHGQLDAPSGAFIDVNARPRNSCGVSTEGPVECWRACTGVGECDAPAGAFLSVAVGTEHACAIAIDSDLECWGYEGYGVCDAPAGEYVAVSAGDYHTCAVVLGGSIACWGSCGWGESNVVDRGD